MSKQVLVTSHEERTLATLAFDLDDENIAAIAFELWQARGCPMGSPGEDWFRAIEVLRSRAEADKYHPTS